MRAILTDSIEVGAANWTPQMIEQFKRLRGYDPTPWLPALTGTIVGSRAESDKFLYDFRRTLADLDGDRALRHGRRRSRTSTASRSMARRSRTSAR